MMNDASVYTQASTIFGLLSFLFYSTFLSITSFLGNTFDIVNRFFSTYYVSELLPYNSSFFFASNFAFNSFSFRSFARSSSAASNYFYRFVNTDLGNNLIICSSGNSSSDGSESEPSESLFASFDSFSLS